MANKIRYITPDGNVAYADAPLIKPIDVAGEKGFGVYHSPIIVTPTGVYRPQEIKPRFFSEEVADQRDAAEIRRKQADEKVKQMFSGKEYAKLGGLTLAGAAAAGTGAAGLGYLSTLPGTVAGRFIGDVAGSMALGMGLEEGQRAAFGRSAGDIVYSQLKPYIGDFGANMARPEYIISPSMVLKNTYTQATNNLGRQFAGQTVKLVKKPSKNVQTQNTLSSHLQGEEAVKMFKQYGGVEIPEGSINGQQLRMYVPEARERYGLVGNTNITDEEIAQALYKHSQELGEGSAAKNIQGEPQLLFRGDTKRYTELKPRITPEELVKRGGTMDNSLGTLFLGELPSQRGGLERYIATIRDFRGVKKLVGSGTGSRAKLPNGDIVKEYVNDEIAVIPEGSYQLFSKPIRQDNISVYKLPASLTETGVNDINAFIVRTPNMRDATREISVLNDDFLVLNGPKVDYYGPVRRQVLDKDGFPLLVDEKGTVVGNGLAGSSERSAMAEHYQQVLNKAQAEQQGLLKSNKNSYLRDEHSGYDYFALPNFNIRGAKHLLPYDLRIPRNWNDPNIYKTIIPIGVTTYGITNND